VTGGEIERLLREALPRAGRTRVLAVDGRSGSGKTALATELRTAIGAAVVSLEDLYGGWDGLEHGIDLLVSEVLEPLAAGRIARVPRYDWTARAWGEPVVVGPLDVLIVEGVGAGARRAAVYESVLVWLEAPSAVRKKRALERDGDVFAPHWEQWAAQEQAMLARERTPERADLILRSYWAVRRGGSPRVRRALGGLAEDRVHHRIASVPNSMTVRAASVTLPDSDG
jgi:uridine kinase